MSGLEDADSEITKSLLRRSAFGADEPVRSQARLKLLEVLFDEGDYAAVSALSGIFLKDSLEKERMELVVAESLYRAGDYEGLVNIASGWDYVRNRDLFFTVLAAEIKLNSSGWQKSLMQYLLAFPSERAVRGEGLSGFSRIEQELKERGMYSSLSGAAKNLLLFKVSVEQGKYPDAVSAAQRYFREISADHVSVLAVDEIARVSVRTSRAGFILREIEDIIDTSRRESLARPVAACLYWGAGYLSDKTGQPEKASRYYLEGMSSAEGTLSDKLLWYWFAGRVRRSPQGALENIDFLVSRWNDPSYFNDILSGLTDLFVRKEDWKSVFLLSDRLKGHADGDIVSRLSYLSARAVEENYIEGSAENAENWFALSVKTGEGLGSGLYYKIMSLAALSAYNGSTGSADGIFALDKRGIEEKKGLYDDLLYGAAEFGLDDYGKELLGLHPGRFSLGSVRFFASCLKERGDYISSIRLLNRALAARGYIADKPDIRVLYPDAFRKEIENVCSKEGLSEPVFFALIREESHFSTTIVSPAGAVGLSQLMPSTAADVASRMRIRADDLEDPVINLKLGGWYFGNLISRTDTIIQALFAYNGGLTRVRRWKRSYPDMPEDLFLETVPYGETSLYGRKVLVSAVIYGYLYYNYMPEEIIRLVFSDNKD